MDAQNTPVNAKPYFSLISTCKLQFRTLQDLSLISEFVNDYFGTKSNVATGIYALALNAIEHGNLEIGYQLKAELIVENIWEQEINKRLEMPEYASRTAELAISKKEDGIYIIVSDQGPGFDWKAFMEIDPGRAGQKHGRGIAIAKSLSFAKLSYNDEGNQAMAFVPFDDNFSW